MPYFVYKIMPTVSRLVKNVELIEQFDKFKQAKDLAKSKRQENDASENITYKVIFAENVLEAEELLQEQREETILKEWEK